MYNTIVGTGAPCAGLLWFGKFIKTRHKFPAKVIRGCVGKKRHRSEGLAEAAARSLKRYEERNDIVSDRPIDVYWCVRCKSYHVGHRSSTDE
jgi:hypothetical protein